MLGGSLPKHRLLGVRERNRQQADLSLLLDLPNAVQRSLADLHLGRFVNLILW